MGVALGANFFPSEFALSCATRTDPIPESTPTRYMACSNLATALG